MRGKQAPTLLLVVILMASLLGTSTYNTEAALQDIAIDLSETSNPDDWPVGIDCTDPDSVYATIYNQGLIIEIDKATKTIVNTFNDPKGNVANGQDFYSLTRDSNGNLFVNQASDGLVWRVDPDTNEWTSKAIVENIDDPDDLKIEYPNGYENDPTLIRFLTSQGAQNYDLNTEAFEMLLYGNGWVWGTLSYDWNFSNLVNSEIHADVAFAGLVKLAPDSLTVFRIPITGAVAPSALHIDNSDNNILWIADRGANKLFKFDMTSETVVQTITIPNGSNPHNLATDATNIYVPLGYTGTPEDGTPDYSLILKINKADPANRQTLNTNALNLGEGTFSVFVDGTNLRFTDLNGNVGFIDIEGKGSFFEKATFADANHFGCNVSGEFFWAAKGSAHIGIAEPQATSFIFNITGKVKLDGGTAKRDVTVYIEGDYGCNKFQRVSPIKSSLQATITMTGVNGGTREADIVSFTSSGQYAFNYIADAGSWGKVSGKATFGQIQDCLNEPDSSYNTLANTMTLTKGGQVWKLQGWTDSSTIQYLE